MSRNVNRAKLTEGQRRELQRDVRRLRLEARAARGVSVSARQSGSPAGGRRLGSARLERFAEASAEGLQAYLAGEAI